MKKDRNSFFMTWGERFFRVRSYTPIPLFLIMFFCRRWEWENDTVIWPIGLCLMVMGESLRLWALRYMGKFSRTRKRKGRVLITVGPYAFIRNPLYSGNLLILLGFAIASELVWFIPIVMILFYLQYYCIVQWEEQILRDHFSQDAESYFHSVPRWLPKWQIMWNHLKVPSTSRYSWANVLNREKSTLQFLVVMSIFLILKELFD
jgi:protein-S-isoprenylcysteine O-methyltransferase Ste14